MRRVCRHGIDSLNRGHELPLTPRPLHRILFFFFFQAEDGIRDYKVTGVQTCALPILLTPYPVEEVDFSVSGAYSLYNWELFYHAPMFVATQLMRNQQYQDAMRWLQIGRASCRERV